mgnify:CR=1 FL=1
MKTRFFCTCSARPRTGSLQQRQREPERCPRGRPVYRQHRPRHPRQRNHLDWRRPYRHHRHRQRFPVRQRAFHPEKREILRQKERLSISKIQRPILSAPTIRTTRREASSQPRPMPRRSRTSLPSTSSLLQEPRETKTTR